MSIMAALAATQPVASLAAASAETAPSPRVEAHSDDLLAVGLVRDDLMTIHLSRVLDNAPVRDAAVTVVLRGVTHPTVAETDGSYRLETPDLKLPGTAAVEFQVTQTAPAGASAAPERLKGTLQIAAAPGELKDQNGARQMGWWVLNFGVCIGFLWLYSRRRKAAEARSGSD